jgi:glycosyltransferase involved in cell wall biosynthesis
MKLSILICTLPERFQYLNRIKSFLSGQIKNDVEVKINDAGKSMPTGKKRNSLIEQSSSDYFCFIDDDDNISSEYVSEILKSIESAPDVVTFNGHMTTDGGSPVDFIIRLGEKYEARKDKDNITRYYRFPNHICVMRREAVCHVKFPDVWQGEDYKWSKEINDKGLLKTEVHIDKKLYHYDFKTKK